ncbi:MAG TPA: S53 family peptidase [Candidatus Saccharimonadales bacterium]|nr:S53 family peptidase [Candidatus Saccharimonadales bacterium]
MKLIRKHLPVRAAGLFIASLFVLPSIIGPVSVAAASGPLDGFFGHSPFHIRTHSTASPVGLDPATIKAVYGLTNAGTGHGTIAIVDAYDAPTAQADLNTFSTQYNLPLCNTTNPCFEKHAMSSFIKADSGWAVEASLDTQWAHAIAPGAKILLVEAKSASLNDLINAVNYARGRSDVVAVSMSWGGGEFWSETLYDKYFTSSYGASFFASSGDSGTGVSWPAVSPNVVGVGGTTLNLAADKSLVSESAWSGSGGGVSSYETRPSYQTAYGLTKTKRSVPDVSYDADPASGVAVYDTTPYQGQTGWYQVGGTSAGAPQWAAIRALGTGVTNTKLYQDATLVNSAAFFRDITSGTNGLCGAVCTAAAGYDTVTGLGSPLTTVF